MDPRQHAWMKSNHPELAQAWREPGAQKASFRPSPESQSHETWAKDKVRLPRKSGPARDFSSLSPDQFARHPGRTSEKDSMEEWGTEAIPGTRGRGKLNLESRNVLDPLAKRDVKQAARRP
jgi:hypothetical protein